MGKELNQKTNHTTMKKQLTNINKFKKDSIPVTENALIEPGKLTVVNLGSKFNGTVYYSIKHDIEVNEPCLIRVEQFVKIARKYDIRSINHESGKVELQTGSGSFSFGSEDVEDFPLIPELKENTGYKITKETIDLYKKYMSSDDLRPAMNGIYFGDGICAVDGHRMRYQFDGGIGEDSEFILGSDAVGLLTQDVYMHGIYERNDTKMYALMSENETIIYDEIIDKFPNWREVIPQINDDSMKCSFQDQEVKKIIEAALIVANERSKQIIIEENGGKLVLTAEDIDLSQSYKSEQFGTAKEGYRSGFNGVYFTEMIKNNPGTIEMIQPNKNRAVIINGNELLMPVLLDSY